MSQSNQGTNNNLKTAAESTHPVADKLKDTLHGSVDTLAEKAAATEASLRESATKGSENFNAKQKELEAKWEHSGIKKYATENPVATAGIAFAAGMLLSSILRRN